MRLVLALMLLMFGFAFPLLLNGQTFTNSVVGLAFVSAAAALALGSARGARESDSTRWSAWLIFVLAVLLGSALLAQLPSAYRFQRGFNRQMERLRHQGPRA
jgi:hypothetical protein